ncbi:MAG: ATP-dependent Clp protease ATP-binding subunit [Acidobacteriaceae bacterium]|nr:ATP-dependent Clp protease ATP-binding subunit [Acidobacteriaceae bacterium]
MPSTGAMRREPISTATMPDDAALNETPERKSPGPEKQLHRSSHEIAKLIGSPPGYLGHRETRALLSQETLNQHHTEKVKISLVLFDEIEKASDALWNLLLGILDKGVLTLGDNRRVDFSSAMVFMTSNLGASEISSVTVRWTPSFGQKIGRP